MYYRSADAVVVVFDITAKASFDECDYWLNEIKTNAPSDIIRILIGNKTDLQGRQVSLEQAQKFAEFHGLKYFECSAFSGLQVKEAFLEILL